MRRHLLTAALILLLPLPAIAQPGAHKTFTVTVEAGKHDRAQTPVCVPMTLPTKLAAGVLLGYYVATIGLPDGKSIAGDFTAPGLLTESIPGRKGEDRVDLHFILPALKAGKELKLAVGVYNAGLGTAGFSWQDKAGEYAELRCDDRPVLRYVYKALDESTPKTRDQTFKVFHHLYDPSGKRLVTNGPGGKFPHHRGLFYGFRKVTYGDGKTVDIWHCPAKEGTYQGHEKVLSSAAGTVLGRHRVQIGWHGMRKEKFATEERELTVYKVPGGTLVEFASKLTPEKGMVKLDGDPQHAGFHVRADNEVSDKAEKQTYFLRPDGKGMMGKERNWPQDKKMVNLPWNAMSFVLGGKRYTAAYLDRPANPKEARYSERTYGRFGSYFVAECNDKKPLTVAYRLWLQEGEMTGDQVKAKDEDFVHPPTAT